MHATMSDPTMIFAVLDGGWESLMGQTTFVLNGNQW